MGTVENPKQFSRARHGIYVSLRLCLSVTDLKANLSEM